MDHELHAQIAANIRRLAEERGVRLSHLADRAGVARSHLTEVLGGRTSPTVQWLSQIASVLGVEVVDLLRP